VEPRVLLEAVEEVDGSVVAGVCRQAVQGFPEHVIQDHGLREVGGVDPPEDGERIVVCVVAAVRRGEEDGRIDERPRHLLGAPRVVVGRDLGFVVAVVAIEAVERTAALLNDPNANRVVVLDVPPEPVAVVDIELATDAGGDVCLVPRDLALGVDALATHARDEEAAVHKCSVRAHYFGRSDASVRRV